MNNFLISFTNVDIERYRLIIPALELYIFLKNGKNICYFKNNGQYTISNSSIDHNTRALENFES